MTLINITIKFYHFNHNNLYCQFALRRETNLYESINAVKHYYYYFFIIVIFSYCYQIIINKIPSYTKLANQDTHLKFQEEKVYLSDFKNFTNNLQNPLLNQKKKIMSKNKNYSKRSFHKQVVRQINNNEILLHSKTQQIYDILLKNTNDLMYDQYQKLLNINKQILILKEIVQCLQYQILKVNKLIDIGFLFLYLNVLTNQRISFKTWLGLTLYQFQEKFQLCKRLRTDSCKPFSLSNYMASNIQLFQIRTKVIFWQKNIEQIIFAVQTHLNIKSNLQSLIQITSSIFQGLKYQFILYLL
ncbi:hypothetical protein pb186bvf_004745 [Paramecium bursaria]